MAMNRERIYKEMKETLGLVPEFFKRVPDSALEHEWELFKATQFTEGAIPKKYRALIGIGISSATGCQYGSLFHTEMARLNGATDEEIEEAVYFAGKTAAWSTFMEGIQIDYNRFKDEIRRICEHVMVKDYRFRECTSYGDWTCREDLAGIS
jgi:AhpD family alkylhydroperoxidase